MKRFLSVLLVALMAFAFVACDNGNGSEEWTEVKTIEGLDGTWKYSEGDYYETYVVSGNTVTISFSDGYPDEEMSLSEFEDEMFYGAKVYVNESKTEIKIVYEEDGETYEMIIVKQ